MAPTPDGVALQLPRKSSKFASGCLFVFAVPFAAVGVLAGYEAVVRFLQAQRDTESFVPLVIGAVIFGGAGFVMMAVAVYNLRHGDEIPEVQRRYPNQPWMWRKEWAEGRISDNSKLGVLGIWVFALIWSGFSVPLAWVILRDEAPNKGVYFVLIFPIIGVGLLAAAVYQTLRYLKYGNSWFVLSTVPGVIGRHLRGSIQTRFRQAPGQVSVRLSAIRCVTTGSGKSRSTTETIKWQDGAEIAGVSLPIGMKGIEIPVSFEIPADAPESDDRDSDNRLVWRLEASADVPGVDYSASFDVPVFSTGAAPLSDAEIEAARDRRRSRARSLAPAEPRILISTTPRGGTEFLFPPMRKVGSTIGAVVFLVVWFAIAAALAMFGAPAIVPAIVTVVGLLILAATLGASFYTARVIVERPMLTIRHSVLGIGPSPRIVPISEIEDVVAGISGSGNATSWEVKVKTRAGQSFTAAALLPAQNEAEWAAEKIRQATKF